MSKTQLQTNNTRLASLIDELKGKAAGSVGGGTSVETCTVTVGAGFPDAFKYDAGIHYVDVDGNSQVLSAEGTITVLKNSFIFVVATNTASMPGDASNNVVVNDRNTDDDAIFLIQVCDSFTINLL